MSQPTINVRVAPSGQGLAFEAFGPDGVTPLAITGFGGLSETQALAITGAKPQSQSFTLTLQGETTGPIPWLRVPPSTAITYNIALPGPGSYDIQAATPSYQYSHVNTYAVYDGVLPGGSSVPIDLSATNFAYNAPGGGGFLAIGRFTFAGSTAIVEISAASGVTIESNAIRVVPVAGGAAIIKPSNDPANTAYSQDRSIPIWQVYQSTAHQGGYGGNYGTLTSYCDSTRTAIQPTFWYADTAAVQSAINTLPGFTTPAVTAPGPGQSSTPAVPSTAAASAFFVGSPYTAAITPLPPQSISLAFSGPKAGMALGPITSSDPSVSSAIVHPGARPITYSIDGGSPTPLGVTTATFNGRAAQSWFMAPFFQSDVYPGTVGGVYAAGVNSYLFNTNNAAVTGPAYSGYSPYAWYAPLPAPVSWDFAGLPGSTTYRFEVTWQVVAGAIYGGQGATTHATYSVTDPKSGTVLASVVVDQTKPPVGVADPVKPGVIWQTILGSGATPDATENRFNVGLAMTGPSGIAVADAARITRTSADRSVTIPPGATVALNAPAGWLLTANGPAAAMVDQLATHAGASYLPPASTITPTMPVGWNVGYETIYSGQLQFSNLVRRAGQLVPASAYQGDPNIATVDGSGYPRGLNVASITIPLVAPGLGPVLPNDPAGVYSAWWDGAATNPPVLCDANGVAYPSVGTTISGRATGNRRYFSVHDPNSDGPSLGITLFGDAVTSGTTRPVTIANLKVYPPDPTTGAAWLDPPAWHPSFVAHQVGTIRFLDGTGAASSNIVHASDAAQVTDFCYNQSGGTGAAIVSIGNHDNADGFFNPLLGAIVRVHCSGPHGYSDYQKAGLYPGPSGTLGTASWAMAGGGPLVTDFSGGRPFAAGTFLDGYQAAIHVLSPTDFAIPSYFNRSLAPATAGSTMTNTLSPVGAGTFAGWDKRLPYAEMYALALQSGRPLNMPIPMLVEDAFLQYIAGLHLTLPVGTPALFEFSNETWGGAPPPLEALQLASYAKGLATTAYTSVPAYLVMAKHFHDTIESVLAAAGRGGELVRLFGSQQAFSGATTSIAQYAVAHAIPIDVIEIAPYYHGTTLDTDTNDGSGIDPAMQDRFNTFTLPQRMDLLALLTKYGKNNTTWADHEGQIKAAGLLNPRGGPVARYAYEGGYETLLPGCFESFEGPNAVNVGLLNAAMFADPQMYLISWWMLGTAQQAGCALWQEYRYGGQGENYQVTWNKGPSTFQPYGTGSASDPAGANQFAGAYRDWAKQALSNTHPKAAIPFHHFFQLAGGF